MAPYREAEYHGILDSLNFIVPAGIQPGSFTEPGTPLAMWAYSTKLNEYAISQYETPWGTNRMTNALSNPATTSEVGDDWRKYSRSSNACIFANTATRKISASPVDPKRPMEGHRAVGGGVPLPFTSGLEPHRPRLERPLGVDGGLDSRPADTPQHQATIAPDVDVTPCFREPVVRVGKPERERRVGARKKFRLWRERVGLGTVTCLCTHTMTRLISRT